MRFKVLQHICLGIALFISILVVFHLKFSLEFIWPANNSILFGGDWAQHYLSWEMFRTQPWQFPLGTLTNYFYPVSTNIGYTDAIPLCAFFFKLLSPVLPQDFQYIGLWLLSSFLLQGLFAVLLLRALRITNPLALYFGAMFFVLSPVLLFRIGHPALCSQWLIVASLWIAVQRIEPHTSIARPIIYQLLLLLLSAYIHPYMALIVLGCTLAYLIRLCVFDRRLGILQCVLSIILSIAIVLSSWYVIGYFSLPTQNAWETGGGFVDYSTTLLTFVNPLDRSAFLPGIPMGMKGQYEGFAYLGLGMIVLIMSIVIKKTIEWLQMVYHGHRPKQTKQHWARWIPLGFVAMAFTVFALSNVVYISSDVLFQYPLPEGTDRITNTFRSGGRFIWLLYYVVFAAVFYALARLRWRSGWVVLLLALTLTLQIVDTRSLIVRGSKVPPAMPYESPLSDEWNTVVAKADVIVMYPPFVQDYQTKTDYVHFVYLAHRYNIPITTGYVARYDADAYAEYTAQLEKQLHSGVPDRNAVYITTPAHAAAFDRWLAQGLVQQKQLDWYIIFISDSVRQ